MEDFTNAEKALLIKHAPHFHVISRGSDSESMGLLKGASPDLVKITSALASRVEHDDPKLNEMLSRLGSNISMEEKKKIMQTGGSFGSVMKDIGHYALKALPTVAPMLLSLL